LVEATLPNSGEGRENYEEEGATAPELVGRRGGSGYGENELAKEELRWRSSMAMFGFRSKF
jgi:hypothetical protein